MNAIFIAGGCDADQAHGCPPILNCLGGLGIIDSTQHLFILVADLLEGLLPSMFFGRQAFVFFDGQKYLNKMVWGWVKIVDLLLPDNLVVM
ncbi:hypothetical protein [Desulforhopalus sp. 52FAK]